MTWTLTSDATPEPGIEVEARDSGGHIHRLKFDSNLWWVPDYKMYVYFTPVAWRYPIKPAAAKQYPSARPNGDTYSNKIRAKRY